MDNQKHDESNQSKKIKVNLDSQIISLTANPEAFVQEAFTASVKEPSRDTIKAWTILSEIDKRNLFGSLESIEV
jgi:hypothetical protein